MENTPSPPGPIKRDRRSGQDHNISRIRKDIDEGFKQFSPIVETIRLLRLDKNLTGLSWDFIKFRDIVAHKPVLNIVLTQMICAFVGYCRETLGFGKKTHEPKTTQTMSEKFPRMADINVAICGEWFLDLYERGLVRGKDVVKWMKKMVEKSSFCKYEFFFEDGDTGGIRIKHPDGKESYFNSAWVEKITGQINDSSVTYDPAEIDKFKECYQYANKCMPI